MKQKKHNQYAVHPPVKEFTADGVPITPKALCYVKDWYTGFAVLTAYKAGNYVQGMERDIEITGDPDEVVRSIIADYYSYSRMVKNSPKKLTFAEVYDLYWKDKFNGKKKFSAATERSVKAAFKNCSSLHEKAFEEITLQDLQETIDACPLKHASLELIRNLYSGMYRYAVPHGIADTNLAQYVKINIPDDDIHGVPFTIDDIKRIASFKDSQTALRIVVMCMTGFRVNEYKTADIKPDRIVGGMKTEAGRNRIVPLHSCILPIIKKADMGNINYVHFLKDMKEFLASHGFSPHTPHDCRHTFSMLCDKFGVHSAAKRKMLGHAMRGDMSDGVYGHWDYDMLKQEIEKVLLTFY